MSSLRLPPGLVDLVLARTTASTPRTARLLHAAAVLKPRIAPPEYAHALYPAAPKTPRKDKAREQAQLPILHHPLPRHLTDLEARVLELKTAATAQDEAVNAAETYSEHDLLALYDDLLALPASTEPAVQEPEAEPAAAAIVAATAARLLPAAVPALARHAVLARLEELQAALDAVAASCRKRVQEQEQEEGVMEVVTEVPVGLLTGREWSALVAHCVEERDLEAAERVLELMKRSKHAIMEEDYNAVLAAYAQEGDVTRADAFVSKFLEPSPTSRQRDLHIKTHLSATPHPAFPTSSLQLLHAYESRALLPPQKSYTRLITRLLSARSAPAHAHAWDLFAHMRYAAHPAPDAFLYATMLRACASPALGRRGAPERALDLFAELPHPDAPAYTAAILACARSGRREYVGEAFRLAKEMLDAHRDARGRALFRPDTRLFCALLEGAKRIGDLARVRWILAEMVRESVEKGEVVAERAVGEEAMVHVFHAYAAYRPPFKRAMAPPSSSSDSPPENTTAENTPDDTALTPDTPALSRLPPQSRAEVLHEAAALFARLRTDALFAHVARTPRLADAYLAVHLAHAPLPAARALYAALHADLGVERGAHTLVGALERCARARKEERGAAARWAAEVWAEWEGVEREGQVDARLVERAYAAMIRVHALTMALDAALALLRAFVCAYPPPRVRVPAPPVGQEVRSGRTRLLGAHPLVRMFSAAEVPDDAVPPLLAFAELEVLHHRLVFRGRARDVGYVKWVCKAYEGALRRRREEVLGRKEERRAGLGEEEEGKEEEEEEEEEEEQTRGV